MTFLLAALLLVADIPYRVGVVLYADDFLSVANWVPELEKPGVVDKQDGALNIDVPAGVTVWFREELTGPVMIRIHEGDAGTG